MAVVGPGALQELATDVKSLLDGANEYEYVTILNPLTDDFAVRVAQDVPINMPMQIRSVTASVQSESDLLRTYGDNFKNPEFKGRKHVSIDTIIPAGQTRNFRGNEAQVALRQLTNELMQREGNTKLLSDPNLRADAEARIVIARNNVQDIMDGNMQTPRSQIDAAIAKSNEVQDEPAFPGLNDPVSGTAESGGGSGADGIPQERRSPGRPKKT